MSLEKEQRLEIARLKKINAALMERVERSMDQQGTGFTLFQTAINLDAQIRQRTRELTATLADLKSSNQELTQARDAALNVNKSKTRFLAAASHDVLQPLNAALLLISSLATVQTKSEGLRLCRQIERSLETMDTLLRTLLYISRLDAGDVRPRWQSVSVDALFDSIASDFEPTAKLRNLELRVRYSGLHVRSDPTMLRRILQNIVTNALRYTESGGVLLIAGSHKQSVHIRIADTGVGIEKQRFKAIFEEFSRGGKANEPDENSSSGLGLGLAIVERMVNTLDHHITLNSRMGHGSCFSVHLPLLKRGAKKSSNPVEWAQPDGCLLEKNIAPASGLAGARLLVIENDTAALRAMESLLGKWGCELRLASSTEEALEALLDGQWEPEVIIADQHLNGNDRGTTAIKTVRLDVGSKIPAVVVTANPSDKLWALADSGVVEVMPKPVKPAQLRALITHMRSESDARVHA